MYEPTRGWSQVYKCENNMTDYGRVSHNSRFVMLRGSGFESVSVYLVMDEITSNVQDYVLWCTLV